MDTAGSAACMNEKDLPAHIWRLALTFSRSALRRPVYDGTHSYSVMFLHNRCDLSEHAASASFSAHTQSYRSEPPWPPADQAHSYSLVQANRAA